MSLPQAAGRVAVIDDDPDFQSIVAWHLNKLGNEIAAIESMDAFDATLNSFSPTVILLDWQFGDVDGTTLIQELRKRFPSTSIVFTTAHATPEVAAKSIQLGAFDFITKPLDESRFELTMARAQENAELLARVFDAHKGFDESEFENIVAASPQMRTVFSAIQNVAQTDAAVLVFGESGVGKELVATAIHLQSARSNEAFVPINMAALPENLVESHLFGHEKGAFTGADRTRPGAVGEADSGTLFLDEITDMPIQLQAKLLRFLQEGTYRPLGSEKERDSDVRIVSATNRNPRGAVDEGFLRQDLYYRLNVIPIDIPPLRERDGDIALLSVHFLRKFAVQYEKDFYEIGPEVLEVLENYPWPGNVRELSHVMQRVVIMHSDTEVRPEYISEEIVNYAENTVTTGLSAATSTHEESAPASDTPSTSNSHSEAIVPLAALEKKAIEEALAASHGVAYEAAKALGISRATIYRKIKLYRINQRDLPREISE